MLILRSASSSFLVFNFFHIFSEALLLVPGVDHLLGEQLTLHLAQLPLLNALVSVDLNHALANLKVYHLLIILLLVEGLLHTTVYSYLVCVNYFPLGSFSTLAVRFLNIPDCIGVVGLIGKVFFSLALPISLLKPVRAIFLLNTLLICTSLNNRVLVISKLLVMNSASVHHLLV